MSFWIRDIPAVMRKNGWLVGAVCMERWFRSPAREMPYAEKVGRLDYRTLPANSLERRLVTMNWAMRFERVFSTSYRLQREWVTQAASDVLRGRVAAWRTARGITKNEFRFGDLSLPTVVVNATCQANSRSVGSPFDGFDDFYAALGRATMHIAVQGTFRGAANGRGVLEVDGMGVYLRDSYDFIGEQGLGYWNRAGVSYLADNALDIPIQAPTGNNDADWSMGVGRFSISRARLFKVTNGSFSNYRNLSKRGGDFTIFTDIHRLVMQPRTIEINL